MFKNLFKFYFRPFRSIAAISGKQGRRLVDRAFWPWTCTLCTLSVDQPVDRLQAINSQFMPVNRPCRSTGSSKSSFCFCLAVDQSQRLLAKQLAGRPAVVQTDTNGSILDLFYFLWVSMAILSYQVAKLTPNDLVTLMNGIYPLPIYRGHVSLVSDKKNIQVSSVFKRRSVLLLSIFKVLSIANFFSWFSSLLNFTTENFLSLYFLSQKSYSTL